MGEMVEFSSNGSTTLGYLGVPESERGPGVVVVQEWWGLVDHIRDVVDRFATEGFVALAPDLYHGEQTSEPDEAAKKMMALATRQAAKDMTGAVDYLAAHPAVTGDGVGAVGFCMGGGLVLWLSTLSDKVRACVPFYGVIPWSEVQPDYSSSKAAYLGHYAENDGSAPPAAVRELEGRLRDHGLEATFHIYPGTDHAFFNDDRPKVYVEEASRLAWERTIEFLRSRLGS